MSRQQTTQSDHEMYRQQMTHSLIMKWIVNKWPTVWSWNESSTSDPQSDHEMSGQ